MGGDVKIDARKALFGGQKRHDGLGSVEIAIHPHLAKLYVFTVNVGEVASAILPLAGSRHLGAGFHFLFVNGGVPGDGTVQFIDADSNPITMSNGDTELDPGDACEIHLRGYLNPEEPSWAILHRGVGSTAKL